MKALSLRAKVLLLLVSMVLIALAVPTVILGRAKGDAVRLAERELHERVFSELRVATTRMLGDATDDARAVAAVLAEAAEQDAKDSKADLSPSIRAVMATRRRVDAARFEVPDGDFSQVFRRVDTDAADVPQSTPEMRKEADEAGAAFGRLGPARAFVVVPVPLKDPKARRGYVTVGFHLNLFYNAIREVADNMDQQGLAVVVADRDRRVLAAYGLENVAMGDDVSGLAAWGILRPSTDVAFQLAVTSDFVLDGTPVLGAAQPLSDFGWAAAVWRPQALAYASLYDFYRTVAIVLGAGVFFAIIAAVYAARLLTQPILRLVDQVGLVADREWTRVHASTGRRDELGQLEGAIDKMARGLAESEEEIARQNKLRGDLSRFMSKELVDAIVRGEHDLALGGKRLPITVLFADVVAFTPLAQSRPPEQVVSMLNELFSVLTEVVFRHGGTVDKFIGDSIMAVWGAPMPQADHADRALAAAEDMMHFLEVAASEWRKKYDVEIRLGIGINSGEAIVGNIGSDKRMEYTVVGDVVNVAARLEGLAAPNQVLVAAGTEKIAKGAQELVPLGPKRLIGRTEPVDVFELVTG